MVHVDLRARAFLPPWEWHRVFLGGAAVIDVYIVHAHEAMQTRPPSLFFQGFLYCWWTLVWCRETGW